MKNISTSAIIIVSIVIGLVFLLLLSNTAKQTAKPITLPVTLEEWGDFQCPACGAYYSVVKGLQTTFGADLKVSFRHFPLTTIHQFAYDSALAAEAAREQGKFDAYHDKLYENQDHLTKDDLVKYATDLKLDVTKFKTDMASAPIKARVDADVAEGTNRGIGATPTFYIDGTIVVLSSSTSESPDKILERLIKEEIDKAKAQITATVTPSVTSTPTVTVVPTK
jgi:protein-disulfide isomerase